MTLTQTALITKRAIFFLILLSAVGTSTFFGYKIWQARYLAGVPKPEEKPDIKFGLLPKPDFLKPLVSSANFSYSIDTQTGGLPNFPKLAKVYYIPKGVVTFASSDKAGFLAQKLGIINPPQVLSETTHQFKDNTKTLTYQLDSGNFIFKKEATAASFTPLGDEKELTSDFRRLLSSLGLLNDDLRNSPSKAKLLKEASAAAVFIWPKDIDKFPIVSQNFTDSPVEATSSGNFQIPDNLLVFKYTFWPVDQKTYATYPLKTAAQALEDLRGAKGIVLVEPKSPKVSITSVYLAYLESENYTPYLLPVFVFEGPNFVAYVNALPDQYVNQSR